MLTNTPVTITCLIHGDFNVTPDDHIYKHSGCPMCGHHMYTQQSYLKAVTEIHCGKYDYSKTEYKGHNNLITIICPEHGEFKQKAKAHLYGSGCLKCRLKSQEKVFKKLVESFPNETILFEVDKQNVPWLNNQRLDIYFPKYNIAVEYDGQQHFQPISIFGGEDRFKLQQQLDTKKEECCIQNHCQLFRLSYNYTNDTYSVLCNKIQTIINNSNDTRRYIEF